MLKEDTGISCRLEHQARTPAMTELMRFLREGVTAAWAASGLDRAAPAATVRAAGIASVCSLFSALQHSHFSVSPPV